VLASFVSDYSQLSDNWQAYFVAKSIILSDVPAMASDKYGERVTFRMGDDTMPAVREIMKRRGIRKMSEFIRQSVQNEIERFHQDTVLAEARLAAAKASIEREFAARLSVPEVPPVEQQDSGPFKRV